MNTILRLLVALLVLAVVLAGLEDVARQVGPLPPGAFPLALVYVSLAVLGFLRLRRSEAKPPKRLSPRRRALPPAPGGDA